MNLTSLNESDFPETAKQHYEKMFIAAFDKNIESLENRFNQNGLEYYEALQQVNQDSNSFNYVS